MEKINIWKHKKTGEAVIVLEDGKAFVSYKWRDRAGARKTYKEKAKFLLEFEEDLPE